MKLFFKELFQYNRHSNQQLIAALKKNPGSASANCIKLLSHVFNVHHIWNARISSELESYGRWDTHETGDFEDIDKKNFDDSVFLLDNFELTQNIRYSTTQGQVFNNSIRDILFHVINHSTYHRGQIATEFRQSGLEPLLTDYIYYKMV